MSLEHLLHETDKVIADLDEARERLHSVPASSDTGGSRIVLGGLGAPAASSSDAARMRLASMPGTQHEQLLKAFHDAGSPRRTEMASQERIRLFSIVFALYRPGPAFGPQHTLAAHALEGKITPGGSTWREFLLQLSSSQANHPWVASWDALAARARHCVRLDHQDGTQAGSGFLQADGGVLTARHVTQHPGWLFGSPPDAFAHPGWVRLNRINGAGLAAEAMIAASSYLSTGSAGPDIAVVRPIAGWRNAVTASPVVQEFSNLTGLALQVEPLEKDELKQRAVVVIGHPLRGNAGGDPADVPIVFGDAPLGTKRFMPGFLDATDPLVMEGGQWLLNHDCSTLGGASGTCLLDLTTGKILGIHVAGLADLGNRAVPAWVAAKELPALLLPPAL